MEEICKFIVKAPRQICGEKAERSVTVNLVTGRARVPMCTEHIAEHDRRAAEKRVSKK